ncbi:MAG: carboxypeptidase regulatory-like domain-containing protein [Deltaproteobacteria bacterium]|nr:carboxypeptidase regulatory-like domain-containing protein [Deltaproteobacteria bacterium]
MTSRPGRGGMAALGLLFLGACGRTAPLPQVSQLSGRVEGEVVEGVTVALSGPVESTVRTDAAGAFRFSRVVNGDYTLTPSSAAGHAFTPARRTVRLADQDAAGLDFSSWVPCTAAGAWDQQIWGPAVELSGVAYSDSLAVVVGAEGTVLTSTGGAAWTALATPLPQANAYRDVARGGGLFVAVGASGAAPSTSAVIATSGDGLAWTERAPAIAPGLNGVAFGNGVFVAAGDLGSLQRSTDGISWSAVPSGTAEHLQGVRFANGLFLATGHAGTVLSSADGLSWVEARIDPDLILSDISHGAGLYVAVGVSAAGAGGRILTSPDLVTWADVAPSGLPVPLRRVAWGGGLFVAVGDGLLTSRDGTAWKRDLNWPAAAFAGRAVAWAGDRLVAAGLGVILSAVPAVEPCTMTRWTTRSSGSTSDLYGLAWSGTRAVAVGHGGTILTSPDAESWLPIEPPKPATHFFTHLAHGGGLFVAVGTRGEGTHFGALISTSPDGLVWTDRTPGASPGLNGVAYGNGAWVAAGNLGSLQRSTDGVGWSAVDSTTSNHLNGVSFANGRFLVSGHSGVLLTSVDGLAWTPYNAGVTVQVTDATWVDGRYVVVGNPMIGGGAAKILTSPDLVAWTDHSPVSTPTYLRRVLYGRGAFLAMGNALATSPDAVAWAAPDLASGASGSAAAWVGDRLVVVGDGGRIHTSP